jgi:hypothetical protein
MLGKLNRYLIRFGIFLITAALIAGMAGCPGSDGGDGGDYYYLTIASTYGGAVTTPGESESWYAANTKVELVAEANEHYHFVNWTGDVSNIADVYAPATKITMNDHYFVTANFELDQAWYYLTIDSTYGGSVTEPGEGYFAYAANTTLDIVAEPDEGYSFLKWTGDVGTIADVQAAATSITIYDSYSITAHFGIAIWDWHDLNAIRDNLGGRYYLMNDLDSTTPGYDELASPIANGGKGWEPIGTTWNNTFMGTFDGQGYEIHDLFINRPDEWGVGLFGWLGEAGVIKNIGIVNVTVIGGIVVGGLVGGSYGTVSNSYSTGSVTGTINVGGLVGVNAFESVSDCYSTCSVAGDRFVGGLIGHSGGPVTYCYATGNVTGDDHVGGLMGQSTGLVSNSYATGSVAGDSSVGGLMGENEGRVRNCYATGDVSGNTRIGGLIGLAHGWRYGDCVSVGNSYSTGSVTGNSYVGGLVGGSYGTVSNSYSTGSVAGISYVGGLVGANWCTDWSCGIVTSSFWDTQTSGQNISAGGTGKNTTEMQDITTFSGATWNITAVGGIGERNTGYIWNIVNNVTYPFLSWQP